MLHDIVLVIVIILSLWTTIKFLKAHGKITCVCDEGRTRLNHDFGADTFVDSWRRDRLKADEATAVRCLSFFSKIWVRTSLTYPTPLTESAKRTCRFLLLSLLGDTLRVVNNGLMRATVVRWTTSCMRQAGWTTISHHIHFHRIFLRRGTGEQWMRMRSIPQSIIPSAHQIVGNAMQFNSITHYVSR